MPPRFVVCCSGTRFADHISDGVSIQFNLNAVLRIWQCHIAWPLLSPELMYTLGAFW
jgi:hypothetical protein